MKKMPMRFERVSDKHHKGGINEDSIKMLYYRGLQEWDREKGYLTDTCLSAQDTFKKYPDRFKILYEG